MKTNRTIGTVLVLICIALWGLLLRPFFSPTSVKAQDLPSPTTATQPPIIMEPELDVPYMVVSNGQISLWFVHIQDPKPATSTETEEARMQEYFKSAKLVRADVQTLSAR